MMNTSSHASLSTTTVTAGPTLLTSLFSNLDQTLGPQKMLKQRQREALIVGTGSAFGNHYTTEQMKSFFMKQRLAAGDTECDFDFAFRVMDACGFDYHSVCLSEQDVFRRMSRSEYLEHRMTNLLDMAARAAQKAIDMWGGNPAELTHLYWGTMTGAMHSPTIDIRLVDKLGLSKDIKRVSIEGMGCLTGYRLLNLGREAALADPSAKILCLEGDLRSAIGNSLPDKATKADIVATSLFRDAASAAIVSGANLGTFETVYYDMMNSRSRIVPDSSHLVDYRELDDGAIRLHLDKSLPDAVGEALPDFVKAMIDDTRARGSDCPEVVDMDIASHTGGPRIVQEVAGSLGVSESALESTCAVMRQHGNLSGASNMSVLDHHNRTSESAEVDNKWVLCVSMGPGVCIEGALLRRINSWTAKESADSIDSSELR